MAGFTFLTKLAFVPLAAVVVFLMATDTGAGRVFVLVSLMTISTFGILVLALQFEFGCVVVKLGFFPIGLIVAIGTLGTQRAFVRIVLFMTTITCQRSVTVFFSRHMALVTGQWLMFAFEVEIRLVVIKLLFIKTGNLFIPPLVVGVTNVASLWFQRAMKTCFGFHISSHQLVTVGTQS